MQPVAPSTLPLLLLAAALACGPAPAVVTPAPAREVLEMVTSLQRMGKLVRITADLSLARESHDELLSRVRTHLREHGSIDVQALKQLAGLSRKFAVPMLEHLDELQITLRQGDTRIPGPKL